MKNTILTKLFCLFYFFSFIGVNANAQIITTIAGSGPIGIPGGSFGGDGGLAIDANLSGPSGVATDSLGNIYIVDDLNNRIRKINASGIISTIAGTDSAGYSGDGGPATAAELRFPGSIALDKQGNIYISDNNGIIRKINTAGIISTYAGNPLSTALGDGGPATNAELSAIGIAIDDVGNVYIADSYHERIRKVDTNGIISTFAGNGFGSGTGLGGFSGDGGPATLAELSAPTDLAFDNLGNLYIADQSNFRVRKVNSLGIITTFAGSGLTAPSGDGGPAVSATLLGPTGVAVDGNGNVYIVDRPMSNVRKVNSSGIITTYAGSTEGFGGDGGMATAAQLGVPFGITFDQNNNLYIADDGNNRVRKVTPSSTEMVSIPTQNLSMLLYPNPATTSLTIQSTNQPINQIAITNILGQTIYTHNYNSEQVQVDVADLPTGLYFVKVNGIEVRKFVKE